MIYSVRGGRKSERLREREIDWERERLEWMEDGGGQIRWVWGWNGVAWWSVVARLVIGGGGQIGQCVGELGGAWPTVGCQDRSTTCTRRCMAGDQRGWSWVFMDR